MAHGRRPDSLHHYYRHPGPGIYIKQIIGLRMGGKQYKLDVKADGNYVIAPGSAAKTWNQPFTPELIASLPVYDPAWLPHELGSGKAATCQGGNYAPVGDSEHEELIAREDLPSVEDRIKFGKRYCEAVPGGVEGDGTNESKLLKLASTLLWGFAIPEDSVYDLLLEWGERPDQTYADGSHYPWEPKQISHKISQALKGYYFGEPGDRYNPDAVVDKVRDKLSDAMKDLLDRRDAKATEEPDEPDAEPENEPKGEQEDEPDVDPEPDTGPERPRKKKNSMLEESVKMTALTPLQAWAEALKRPREPFIEGHSTFGDLTMLFGVAGGGKSEIVKHIIMKSIFRQDFFGKKIKQAHHLYIDPENGQNTLFDLYAACGTDPGSVMDLPDPFSEDWDSVAERSAECYEMIANHARNDEKLQALEKYLTIVSDRPENFGPESLGKLLEERRSLIGPKERLVTYLDPFRALHSHIEGYDENSVNCIQPLLDGYNRVAKEFNVALWILHHTLKSNNGKGVGSGAFYGAASNILIYERSPEDYASPGILKVYRMRGQSPGAPIRIGYDAKLKTMIGLPSEKNDKEVEDDITDRQHMRIVESILLDDKNLNQSQITVKATLKAVPKNRVPILLGMLVEAGRAKLMPGENNAKLYRKTTSEE